MWFRWYWWQNLLGTLFWVSLAAFADTSINLLCALVVMMLLKSDAIATFIPHFDFEMLHNVHLPFHYCQLYYILIPPLFEGFVLKCVSFRHDSNIYGVFFKLIISFLLWLVVELISSYVHYVNLVSIVIFQHASCLRTYKTQKPL